MAADDFDEFKLLPDLPASDDDGTVERVLLHQLSTEELEAQWKDFIENANALIDQQHHDGLSLSTNNIFNPQVSSYRSPLFARDAFHVRQGYRSQEMEFDIPHVVQKLEACTASEAQKTPNDNYAVEICPQGRVTTIQKLQASVEHTLEMHKNMINCIANVVTLLDNVVQRLNNIDETLKENAIKRRRTTSTKEFQCRQVPKSVVSPKKLR